MEEILNVLRKEIPNKAFFKIFSTIVITMIFMSCKKKYAKSFKMERIKITRKYRDFLIKYS